MGGFFFSSILFKMFSKGIFTGMQEDHFDLLQQKAFFGDLASISLHLS